MPWAALSGLDPTPLDEPLVRGEVIERVGFAALRLEEPRQVEVRDGEARVRVEERLGTPRSQVTCPSVRYDILC